MLTLLMLLKCIYKSSDAIYLLALLTNVIVDANSIDSRLAAAYSVSSLFDKEAFKIL